MLLGKDSADIDAADMGWAARVSALHLTDMLRVAEQQGLVRDALTLAGKAQSVVRRFRTLQPVPLTARKLQQSVWGVANAGEARALNALVR